MQCWNCQFENLPGLAACGRCGSPLNLDDVPFEPRRAGVLRLRSRVSTTRWTLADLWRTLDQDVRTVRFTPASAISARQLAWSIVPGLGHIRAQMRFAGLLTLALWLALVGLAHACFEWWLSGWLHEAAVALHLVSIALLLWPSLASRHPISRIGYVLLIFVVLRVGVYSAGGAFLSNYYLRIPASAATGDRAFGPGDGLLIAGRPFRPAQYRRGELVVCSVWGVAGLGYVLEGGYNVDRILGLPGDRIDLDSTGLRINGQPPLLPPGRPNVTYAHPVTLRLQADEYFIFPPTLRVGPGIPEQTAEHALRRVAVVPYRNIVGRVIFRIEPWSRIGRVE